MVTTASVWLFPFGFVGTVSILSVRSGCAKATGFEIGAGGGGGQMGATAPERKLHGPGGFPRKTSQQAMPLSQQVRFLDAEVKPRES